MRDRAFAVIRVAGRTDDEPVIKLNMDDESAQAGVFPTVTYDRVWGQRWFIWPQTGMRLAARASVQTAMPRPA